MRWWVSSKHLFKARRLDPITVRPRQISREQEDSEMAGSRGEFDVSNGSHEEPGDQDGFEHDGQRGCGYTAWVGDLDLNRLVATMAK